MVNAIVRYGQSLMDIASMYYGDVQSIWKLIDDNQLTVDFDFQGGESLLIDPTFSTNTSISNYFQLNPFVVNNSDNDPIAGIVYALKLTLLQIGNEINGGDGYITIDVSGGVTPYSFEWTDQTSTVVSNQQNLINASAGTYAVKVTDNVGTIVSQSFLVVSVGTNNVYLVDDFGNLILDGNGNPIVVV